MNIICHRELHDIYYNTDTKEFNTCNKDEFMRWMVGRFSNKDRLIGRFITPNKNLADEQRDQLSDEHYQALMDFFQMVEEEFDNYEPFTFTETWQLKSDVFQKAVFDTVDLTEMIEQLNGERIKVDGVEVPNIVYDKNGNVLETVNQNNVYEVYRCDASSLKIGTDYIYALKMWCTSTDKEHYIWINENSIDNPLEAISGTFQIHKNVLDKMVCLKRQGDILAVETSEPVEPEGEMVTLTKDQYFRNLVSQS